jgi:hypothetical protein
MVAGSAWSEGPESGLVADLENMGAERKEAEG